MMREVLQRRFKRLVSPAVEDDGAKAKPDDESFPQWPDLVIIDGGRGQLNAVKEIFEGLGLTQVSLLAVAKGPDRDAGRETLFMPEGSSSSSRATRRCTSFSGCGTRRIGLSSAHTANCAKKTFAKPACRRSPGSAPHESGRCCTILER